MNRKDLKIIIYEYSTQVQCWKAVAEYREEEHISVDEAARVHADKNRLAGGTKLLGRFNRWEEDDVEKQSPIYSYIVKSPSVVEVERIEPS